MNDREYPLPMSGQRSLLTTYTMPYEVVRSGQVNPTAEHTKVLPLIVSTFRTH